MADIIYHAPAAASARRSLLDRLVNALHVVADAWTRAISYRRTLNALSALSDRELDDLGLTRGQIQRSAYRAVYER